MRKKSIEDFKYVTPEEYAEIGHEKAANRELMRKRASENPEHLRQLHRDWRNKNPDKVKANLKKYYEANKEDLIEKQRPYKASRKAECLAYSKAYVRRHPEERVKTAKRYRDRNKPKLAAYNKAWQQMKMKTDPSYRLRVNLTIRVWQVLKSQCVVKTSTTMKLVGCTKAELMSHLQRQFKPGMSWNNYGPVWHVDHIKPCCKFDFSDLQQQKECFHWTNLQPLFGSENIKKGGRYKEVTT